MRANADPQADAVIHPVAWLFWLIAVVTALSLTRNPLYLMLIFAELLLVTETAGASDAPAMPLSPLRFALWMIPVGALFNALTTHAGETALVTLPRAWPLIGGPITAEGALYGAINGLVLAALFAAFSVLQLALPVRDLIRLLPRAFYPVAVVVSIAVTFVPTTLRQMAQIREAQAIRGHRMRGVRDWAPLFMPLLVGGLERAFQLAEAMTARGFATGEGDARDEAALIGLLAALALMAGGALGYIWGGGPSGAGMALLVAGGALLVWVLRRMGGRTAHTTYRRRSWTAHAGGVALGAGLALAGFVLLAGETRGPTPYPALTLPGFAPLAGIALLGFLAPALAALRREVG